MAAYLARGEGPAHSFYRADVDGMRAIAVIAVIVFHVHSATLPAGYLGVDVFFVISGYVITGALFREYARTERLDILAFWGRRVKRLAPALLLVLAAILLFTPILLERISGEVGVVAKSAVAVLLINQNHYLLHMANDYFAELTEHNPLLHMWSLSVEEQYYLIWPLFFATLMRATSKRALLILGLLWVGAVLIYLMMARDDPQKAFYLMPARAWELLAGAVIAVGTGKAIYRIGKRVAFGIGCAGLVILLACLTFRSTNSELFVVQTVLLVIGASLLIFSGCWGDDNQLTAALGHRWLRYLGQVSYPLYLWHWPILVMSRSTRLYEPNLFADISGALFALLLAIGTYELVERKTWRWLWDVTPRRMVSYAAAAAASLAVGALVIGAWARFGWWYDASEKRLDASRRDRPEAGCMFDGVPSEQMIEACFPPQQGPSVLVWGDSHAEHWVPAFQALRAARGAGLGVLTLRGCRPLPAEVRGGECGEFNSQVLARIKGWRESRGLRGVVLVGRWSDGLGIATPSVTDIAFAENVYYDSRASSREQSKVLMGDGIQKILEGLAASGVRILLIADSPIQKYDAQHCLARKSPSQCFVLKSDLRRFTAVVDELFARESMRQPMVRVIDPKSFMCGRLTCPAVMGEMIVYSDDDHVTASFAISSSKYFSRDFDWMIGQ